jgi:hypothetical protein
MIDMAARRKKKKEKRKIIIFRWLVLVPTKCFASKTEAE